MWNINDLTMVLIYWVYFTLRLTSEPLSRNFILVKSFEFEDSHLETEIIIDMLQKEEDQQYVKTDLDETTKKMLNNDYIQ